MANSFKEKQQTSLSCPAAGRLLLVCIFCFSFLFQTSELDRELEPSSLSFVIVPNFEEIIFDSL